MKVSTETHPVTIRAAHRFHIIAEYSDTIKALLMNDAATWYILNTTGTKDAKGHEVSEEIKEMLAYMNGSAPESDY